MKTGNSNSVRYIKRKRTPFPKQVHLLRTAKVPDRAMDAVHSGIRFILDTGRADIEIVDLRDWGIKEDPEIPHMSLDWYQAQALIAFDRGFGLQVDAA